MSRAEVVVIGSYNADLILSVARLPSPGETCLSLGRQDAPGGKGSNQAVQAARCGAKVAFIGALGRDDAADAALALWADNGVDATSVQRLAGQRTGMAAILVSTAGENSIVVDSGANLQLSAQHVAEAADTIGSARLVLAQLEVPTAAILAGFELARAAGVMTALNAAPAPERIDAELLAATDLLFVNEGEAAALSGVADVETAAARLLGRVRRGVVVTLGGEGAALFRRDAPVLRRGAVPVNVVDTTGAGDAFIGAFAARYATQRGFEDAMAWGVTAGALACRRAGAATSFADAAAIAASLAEGRGRALP
jgi:ribokinase